MKRDRRVAEAAYYRAEKRGFAYGFALEDWLAAESLVDHEIKNSLANEPAVEAEHLSTDPTEGAKR